MPGAVKLPNSLTSEREMAEILKSVVKAGDALPINTYVELGTRKAGTAARVKDQLIKLKRTAQMLGVDKDPKAEFAWQRAMGNDPGGHRTGVSWNFHVGTTISGLALFSQKPCLAWVMVDACHCFECAYEDMEWWSALVAPGGILLAHDTTKRRKGYTKHFQHGGTRPFGSWQAAEAAEADDGCMHVSRGWRRIAEVEDLRDKNCNGVRIYQKEKLNGG
jgi:hypothetical protein